MLTRTKISVVLFSATCRIKLVARSVGKVLRLWFVDPPVATAEALLQLWLSRPRLSRLKLHLFTKNELTFALRDAQALNRMLHTELTKVERECRELRIQHKLTMADLRAAWAELGERTRDELSEFIDTAKQKSLFKTPVPTPTPADTTPSAPAPASTP